jgi:hydroxyacylglutathione hydrolase
MPDESLPLEDTFGDVLRKAMRGRRISTAQLAGESGIAAETIASWLRDDGAADEAQAHALARALKLDGAKLAERGAQAWYPPPIALPYVRRHAQRPHPSNGYVFFLENGGGAALVDPAGAPANVLRVLRDYDLRYILITHKHADHCDAAGDVARTWPNAAIVMHELDLHAIGRLGGRARLARDGETLPFGSDSITMFHTPGHTDGSICYRYRDAVFSGDTMFAGSVGGAYGDKSTYADILQSIRRKLFTLPEETVVMPGHGPPTTIALEKQHDPFF